MSEQKKQILVVHQKQAAVRRPFDEQEEAVVRHVSVNAWEKNEYILEGYEFNLVLTLPGVWLPGNMEDAIRFKLKARKGILISL